MRHPEIDQILTPTLSWTTPRTPDELAARLVQAEPYFMRVVQFLNQQNDVGVWVGCHQFLDIYSQPGSPFAATDSKGLPDVSPRAQQLFCELINRDDGIGANRREGATAIISGAARVHEQRQARQWDGMASRDSEIQSMIESTYAFSKPCDLEEEWAMDEKIKPIFAQIADKIVRQPHPLFSANCLQVFQAYSQPQSPYAILNETGNLEFSPRGRSQFCMALALHPQCDTERRALAAGILGPTIITPLVAAA